MAISCRPPPGVIIAVTESDAHVVGNRILELALLKEGFRVINLGVCTPAREIAEAFRDHENILAIAIGSINGHGGQDLRCFGKLRQDYQISCRTFFGGYLEVGVRANMSDFSEDELEGIGIDEILDDIPQLVNKLIYLRSAVAEINHG